MNSPTEEELISALRASGEELSRDLRDAIIHAGADIVPELIDVLESDEDDAVDGGWAPIHAVDLLVDLKARDGVEPMLEILGETTSEHIIHDRILTRLPELGEMVLGPALAFLEDEEEEEFHESLCCVLSQLGIRNERVFSELCTLAAASPITGAMCLGDYGDPRGLHFVEEAIVHFELDEVPGMGILGLDELVHAYVQLDGELPAELGARVAALKAEWAERAK
jgi:hypothetical protein